MRTVQDKKEDIRRPKERVANSYDEGMENEKKETWFGMMEAGRFQTLRNVTILMEYYFGK